MKTQFTNEDLSKLPSNDLYDYLYTSSECSVIRCTYDNSCLHQVGFTTCGGPQYGTTGIFLKAEVPAKKWWELKYRNVILSKDVEPLSDERRTELAKYHDKEVYFCDLSKRSQVSPSSFGYGKIWDSKLIDLKSPPPKTSFEEELGQKVVENTYLGNVEFFEKLLEAAKKVHHRYSPKLEGPDDEFVLGVLSQEISRTRRFPTKKELRLAIDDLVAGSKNSRFGHRFGHNRFRYSCEKMGLLGLPGELYINHKLCR